jgi:hypothetical protein
LLWVFCVLGLLASVPVQSQTVFSPDALSMVFNRNQVLMQQEKVYVQTDKPFYTAGDTIWASAHLVLADTHQPSPYSSFILAELYDPGNKLINRYRIGSDSLGFFALAMPLSANLSLGFYTLRAYTKRMQKGGDDFLFRRSVFIGNSIKSNNEVKTSKPTRPVKTTTLPVEKKLDLQFLPEGGHLIAGCMSRVAFKAIGPDGRSKEVSGIIRNSKNEEVGAFNSSHLGMGTVALTPERGEQYTAYLDKSSENFLLPVVEDSATDLQVSRQRGILWIRVVGNQQLEKRNCWLLAHCRGKLLFTTPVSDSGFKVDLPERSFPKGIVHFVLMDGPNKVLSERLVFILRSDSIKVESRFTSASGRRLPVHGSIQLADKTGVPIAGNFSASITDNGQIIRSENEENIWSTLLLTSDLKGTIENPGGYFNPKNTKAPAQLDLVMLTHGWSRFNVADRLIPMDTTQAFVPEHTLRVTGMVKNIIGLPAPNFPVLLISPKANIFRTINTDKKGKFSFDGLLFTDSTRFNVQASTPSGKKTVDVLVDEERFPNPPEPTSLLPADSTVRIQKNYDSNVRTRYYQNGNMMNVDIQDITVTTKKNAERKRNSPYYFSPDEEIGEEVIDKWGGDIYGLLNTILGVQASNGDVSIRNSTTPPMFILDGVVRDIEDLGMIIPQDVESIDILKDLSRTGIFGQKAKGGVISIWLKRGASLSDAMANPSMMMIAPLGCFRSATFYQPRYDLPAIRESREPDLRTTMFWCPNLRAGDDGKLNLDFFTGDTRTNYQLVLEGVGDKGELVHYTCPVTP